MPRPKFAIPTVAEKFYLTQENAASLALYCHSEVLGRQVHGMKSAVVNEALAFFFSPSYKEYLQWKAQKPQHESATSEARPNEAKS